MAVSIKGPVSCKSTPCRGTEEVVIKNQILATKQLKMDALSGLGASLNPT